MIAGRAAVTAHGYTQSRLPAGRIIHDCSDLLPLGALQSAFSQPGRFQKFGPDPGICAIQMFSCCHALYDSGFMSRWGVWWRSEAAGVHQQGDHQQYFRLTDSKLWLASYRPEECQQQPSFKQARRLLLPTMPCFWRPNLAFGLAVRLLFSPACLQGACSVAAIGRK